MYVLLLCRYESGRFLELLNYALNPGNEVVTAELFEAGFESGAYGIRREERRLALRGGRSGICPVAVI